jgi:hypothetical protein
MSITTPSTEVPQFYTHTQSVSALKSLLINTKTKTLNTMYSNDLPTSNFASIHTMPSVLPPTICDMFIAEGEKFAEKQRGWLFNKAHDYGVKQVPLGVVVNLFAFLKNLIYRQICPFIEEKYELLQWSLDIADGSLLKIEEMQKPEDFDMHKGIGEFTLIIPLSNSKNGLVFESGETMEFGGKGDAIVFCSRTNKKFVGVGEESHFIMISLKYLGGYKSAWNHNVHPNLLSEEERKKGLIVANAVKRG